MTAVLLSDLGKKIGRTVRIEGEIAQIKQTSGPTIFTIVDESGTENAAAFVEAGVRAYPEAELSDLVRIVGEVMQRNRLPEACSIENKVRPPRKSGRMERMFIIFSAADEPVGLSAGPTPTVCRYLLPCFDNTNRSKSSDQLYVSLPLSYALLTFRTHTGDSAHLLSNVLWNTSSFWRTELLLLTESTSPGTPRSNFTY